jgi:parvulin-like peptidyl-prolyl isomerase
MRRRAVINDPKQKSALLDELIERAALLEKAKAAGLDREPELRRSWENMLIGRLHDADLESRLTNAMPSPDQVLAYYRANLAHYTEPALRRGAVLFAEVLGRSSAEQKEKSRRRLMDARVKANLVGTSNLVSRGFGVLATEYSEDQATRYRGGEMGWIKAGQGDARYDKPVLDALFALEKPGMISDLVETPRGYYLVLWMEGRGERVKSLESVQAAIQHQLLIRNRQQIEADWKKEARTAYPAQVFADALRRAKSSVATPETSPSPAFP